MIEGYEKTLLGRPMTETEWLAAIDPMPMLKHLGDRTSNRKRRLFCHFCCQMVRDYLDDRGRASLDIAGEYPDFPACRPQLEAALCIMENVIQDRIGTGNLSVIDAEIAVRNLCRPDEGTACIGTAFLIANTLSGINPCDPWDSVERCTSLRQTRAVRCIFGNPFRTAAIDPSWLTSDVQTLATSIYQERVFDRIPILADALQDAGCDHEDILNHCRQAGEHVRGCWVVDLILGKS